MMETLLKPTKLIGVLILLIVIQQIGQSIARRPKHRQHEEEKFYAGEEMLNKDCISDEMVRKLDHPNKRPIRPLPIMTTMRPNYFIRNSTLLARSCGRIFAEQSARISGGWDTKVGHFPSFVEVRATFMNPPTKIETCGGVIIGDSHVLTVARCVEGARKVVLTAKWNRRDPQEILEGQKWCSSRNYDNNKLANDFAIVKTKKKFWYDFYVQPACLPTQPIKSNMRAQAVGMGFIDSDNGKLPEVLQALSVNKEFCYPDTAPANSVCFGPSDGEGSLCAGKLYGGGDAGAPIYTKIKGIQTVIALASYGPEDCKIGSSEQTVGVDIFSVRNEILDLMEATQSLDRSCGNSSVITTSAPSKPTGKPTGTPTGTPEKPNEPTRSSTNKPNRVTRNPEEQVRKSPAEYATEEPAEA